MPNLGGKMSENPELFTSADSHKKGGPAIHRAAKFLSPEADLFFVVALQRGAQNVAQ